MLLALRILFAVLAATLCICTLMPLVRTTEWWVRGFDFPRIQTLVIMVAVLLGQATLGVLAYRQTGSAAPSTASIFSRAILPTLLLVALCWQCYRIFPYTPLAPYQMQQSRKSGSDSTLRLLIFNVRYDSRESLALLRLINEKRPDVVLLAEPTHWWHDQLETLEEEYPHTILQPQENHYGMLLYSRLELINPRVRFLVEDEVPSIDTEIRLRSGETLSFRGLHPKPPGLKRRTDTNREDSGQRDAELITVAKEIKQARDAGRDTPTIVAGDFNDVAWSHTTRLFRRVSGLLDPRIGRGLYNSYSAESRIYRFPIDHVFASEHFRLMDMKVLPPIGSDHHPVIVTLSLEPSAPATQDKPDPQGDDLEEAEETIEEGKEEAGDGS